VSGAPLLATGERVLLIDAKQRRYLLRLREGENFHTHAGILAHDDIIGKTEGATVVGTTGRAFLVFRPTLADVVLKMPRGAQVIYPKDLGAILVAADVGPGQRILEAGVGSGALSMTLLRAGARVIGYELREDFAKHAMSNVAEFLGPDADYRVEVRDATGARSGHPRPARTVGRRPARRPGAPAWRDPARVLAHDQSDRPGA
jgi:tRNA (adenine57-N1/adenine58-N1)-methyltransferase catalytic subunit